MCSASGLVGASNISNKSRVAGVPSVSGYLPKHNNNSTDHARSSATSPTRALSESSRQSPLHQCHQASMKRKCTSHAGGPRKKAHLVDQSARATPSAIEQPVLQRFYPRLLTLRHYLLFVLPKASKNRRRKLAQLGRPIAAKGATSTCDPDSELGHLLDSTVIGGQDTAKVENEAELTRERDRDIETFTQQLSPAITGGTFKPGYFLQAEVGFDTAKCYSIVKGVHAGAKKHRLLTL